MITRRLAAEASDTLLPGKATKLQPVGTVPQTDTGGQDENSQALERTQEKELGKLPPYLRKKEALIVRKHFEGAQARG